jgi:predicted phage tail protein
MKTIVLNGQLGKQFGRLHKFDVATAAEAVRALVANFPAVEKHLMQTKCLGYRVKLHDAPLRDIDELHHPVGGNRITITPVISGAGGSVGTILLGAALIAAAFFTGGASIAASGFLVGGITTTFWGGIAVGIGTSLVLGGISQMLSPVPKAGDPAEAPGNSPSYVFNGPVNTTAQGHPVPVGYGRMLVGGAVISAGITTEETAI